MDSEVAPLAFTSLCMYTYMGTHIHIPNLLIRKIFELTSMLRKIWLCYNIMVALCIYRRIVQIKKYLNKILLVVHKILKCREFSQICAISYQVCESFIFYYMSCLCVFTLTETNGKKCSTATLLYPIG